MRKLYAFFIVPALLAFAFSGCAPAVYSSEPVVTAAPAAVPIPVLTPAPAAAPEPTPFTVVWMSDTQHYSNGYLEYFTAMTEWTAANRDRLNVPYVIHTGDIVGTCSKEYTWVNAEEAMSALSEADMPVFMLAGNHDSFSARTKDFTRYLEFRAPYLEPNELSYSNGLCTAVTFSAAGRDFLLVGISCNVLRKSRPAIAWVNAVLAQYPEHIAILCFHSYMNAGKGLVADGVVAYSEIIPQNPNVRLVLCGHCRGVSHKVSQFDDDGDGTKERTVDQLMMNYQSVKKGGLGYLVLLRFYPDDGRMDVISYSPFLDDYGYYPDYRDVFSVENVF